MADASKQEELENGFRSSLEDVERIIEKLAPYCNSPKELLDMVRLGKESDGQLRLLINIVLAPTTQGKK